MKCKDTSPSRGSGGAAGRAGSPSIMPGVNMFRFLNRLRLQTRIFVFMSALCLVVIFFQYAQMIQLIRDEYYGIYAAKALHVAREVARDPHVIRRIIDSEASDNEVFFSYMETLTRVSEARYIVPMTMEGIRLFHPDRARIGQHFVGGDESRALAGETYVSSARGTLGYSQRAFTPMYGPGGEQIGVVAVGIMTADIDQMRGRTARSMVVLILLTLGLGLGVAVLFARSIKKILLGLEPAAIAQLLEERSAMLRLMNEGVLAVNLKGRITMANNEARRILAKAGIAGPLRNAFVEDVIPCSRLYKILQTGEAEHEVEQSLPPITILSSNMPLIVNGVKVGAISTFRDLSEVRAMAGRLVDLNRYVGALRSQSHEFMNKLHAMLGLLQNGKLDELNAYIMQVVDVKTAENMAVYESIKDPVIAGFMISKYAQAMKGGVQSFTLEGVLPVIRDARLQNSLITILGNLIDNALDAVRHSAKKTFSLTVTVEAGFLEIFFVDSGCGMDESMLATVFDKGVSTKGEDRGFGLWLLTRAVDVEGGTIEVSSRLNLGTAFQICLPFEETE